MKFLKTEDDQLALPDGKREKALLTDLLKLYPLIPPAHHQVTPARTQAPIRPTSSCWTRRWQNIARTSRNSSRPCFSAEAVSGKWPTGFLLVLDGAEMEWLLQVLNDIRVGSWLLLGSPDEKKGKSARLNLQTARYLWTMELCGHFQHIFITKPERK